MRQPLNVWDHGKSSPNVFLELVDILAVLPQRKKATEWTVTDFIDAGGESLFDIVADIGHDRLSSLANTDSRLTFQELTAAAAETRQVIWGSFRGYDNSGNEQPWVVVSAVDSSFWEIVTDDLETRRRIKTQFKDVRKGKM